MVLINMGADIACIGAELSNISQPKSERKKPAKTAKKNGRMRARTSRLQKELLDILVCDLEHCRTHDAGPLGSELVFVKLLPDGGRRGQTFGAEAGRGGTEVATEVVFRAETDLKQQLESILKQTQLVRVPSSSFQHGH